MKDQNTPRKTETGAKDHDPQQDAQQIKSHDNLRSGEEGKNNTPNHPHPADSPTGKRSGGSNDKPS